MNRFPVLQAVPFAGAMLLAACSSGTETDGARNHTAPVDSGRAPTPASLAPSPSPTARTSAASAGKVIGLEGLGRLRLGAAVPENSGWKARGAQVSDQCTTVSSPDYPGVYAIVEKGLVRRITAGKGSNVRLLEGIGAGSSEADVRKWFAGFRATPHVYEEAPAKYLTAPNAESGAPALRFEIGRDGRVNLIHVGTMPTLGYVEGCA